MASSRFNFITPVRAIFLDLDGTLLDNGHQKEAINRTCEEVAAVQPGLDAARLAEINSRVWEAYWPQVENDFMLGHMDGASVSLEAWRRALQACGCREESVARLAADTHAQLSRSAYCLFSDVLDFLATVTGAHVPLALITNGASDTQRDKLSALGIESWFDSVVISGEVGIAKPSSTIFELALGNLTVDKEAVCHVGDSLVTDVAGANAAGLTSIWLNRTGVLRTEDDPEPDIEIRLLSDLVTS